MARPRPLLYLNFLFNVHMKICCPVFNTLDLTKVAFFKPGSERRYEQVTMKAREESASYVLQ